MRFGSWIPIFLAVASLGLGSGCGSAEKRSSQAQGFDTLTAPKGGNVLRSLSRSGANTSPSGSAIEEMGVFSRPHTKTDALPRHLWYRLHNSHHCSETPGGCLGKGILNESRLLLSGLGVRGTRLYAWPTKNGFVCWAWAEGAGGCLRDFGQGGPRVPFMGIDPDDTGVGYPGTLVSIVPDDVLAAEVQVRGTRYPAIVGSNGIFYELPDGSCTNWAFESLTVTYSDGSSETVPIRWHEGPSELPETCAA